MYHLRLCKALSYSGAISATHKHPDVYVEDEATATTAVATGYFRLLGGAAQAAEPEPENGPEPDAQPDYEALSAMKKAELVAYAEEHGIDLSGCSSKEDILSAISVAYGGSYTMIDLQKQD